MESKTRRKDNVSVKEAASRLNVHQDTIKAGLISGQLTFGSAIKCKRNYSYIIPRERFDVWKEGKDLAENGVLQNQVMQLVLRTLKDVNKKLDTIHEVTHDEQRTT